MARIVSMDRLSSAALADADPTCTLPPGSTERALFRLIDQPGPVAAPEWLIEAVEKITGRNLAQVAPRLPHPTYALCRAELRRWASRQSREAA